MGLYLPSCSILDLLDSRLISCIVCINIVVMSQYLRATLFVTCRIQWVIESGSRYHEHDDSGRVMKS